MKDKKFKKKRPKSKKRNECCELNAFWSSLYWDGKNHRCPDCNKIYK